MAPQLTQTSQQFDGIPAEIEADGSKLVYLFLAAHGESNVSELSESLGMTKLSLYSSLDTLTAKDLVEGDGWSFQTAA